LGVRQDGVLVSEASIPAVPALTAGRVYVEIGGAVDTGISIANPNAQAASFSFFFTDESGQDFGNGNFSIPSHGTSLEISQREPFQRLGSGANIYISGWRTDHGGNPALPHQ
jgi:hypothetical protein